MVIVLIHPIYDHQYLTLKDQFSLPSKQTYVGMVFLYYSDRKHILSVLYIPDLLPIVH